MMMMHFLMRTQTSNKEKRGRKDTAFGVSFARAWLATRVDSGTSIKYLCNVHV